STARPTDRLSTRALCRLASRQPSRRWCAGHRTAPVHRRLQTTSHRIRSAQSRVCDLMAVHETKSPRPTDADSAAVLVKAKVTESAKAMVSVALVADLARKQKADRKQQTEER